jgi:hypothetical protein
MPYFGVLMVPRRMKFRQTMFRIREKRRMKRSTM